ncbi:hypothetical protein [Pontibacter anaerobius]|uniref:SWFGD domain-containing protein n=1 Tax=Pontibacter anaerobius TaxID=2993940 RepID=A0ABT3REJ5_9BACT|nr:hypothetical protein [Pontibacter anaerobius]MCX2740288.1 hypothetical protein [Pontibacter anaerobius]
MRNDRDNSRYYHSGLWTGKDVYDFDRDTRDGDFGREHQDRYSHGNNPHDFRDRRDFDANRFQNYRSRDYDMEDNYYDNTSNRRHDLGDIRQGYGISSFEGSSDRYDDMRGMQRERRAQQEQGYGSGRLSGYSGSRFGGANYSAHGEFGGGSGYGSMSGGGGNMDDSVSSSGYGGGYGQESVHSNRGIPNYSSNRRSGEHYGYSGINQGGGVGSSYGGKNFGGGIGYEGGHAGGTLGSRTYGSSSGNYGGYGSMASGDSDTGNFSRENRTDRGGYRNQDPNY